MREEILSLQIFMLFKFVQLYCHIASHNESLIKSKLFVRLNFNAGNIVACDTSQVQMTVQLQSMCD